VLLLDSLLDLITEEECSTNDEVGSVRSFWTQSMLETAVMEIFTNYRWMSSKKAQCLVFDV